MVCLKCTNTLFMPEAVGTCNSDVIDFGMTATIPGEHTLQLHFLGSILTIKKSFLEDELISFPTRGLNESFQYVGKVLDPEGEEINVLKNSILYNCFAFETTFKINL